VNLETAIKVDDGITDNPEDFKKQTSIGETSEDNMVGTTKARMPIADVDASYNTVVTFSIQ
jgi:hypothetical protein